MATLTKSNSNISANSKIGSNMNPKINSNNSQKTESSQITKKLGSGVLLFILINAILGSSLFYIPSLGIKSSGPASIIAWVLLYIFAIFIMLYIAELLTLFPNSRGTYGYCKASYNRPIAFTAGWLIWIAGNLGMSLNIVAAAQYFIPDAFVTQIIFSLVWIVALNYMAFRGIDASSTMLVTFGIFSVIVVSLLILPSFINLPSLLQGTISRIWNPELIHPFFLHTGKVSIVSYLLLSFFLISESFFGFDTITYLAGDAKNKKSLHKTLFAATIISGSVVTLYILSSLGTIPFLDYVNSFRPWAVQALNTLGLSGQSYMIFGMYLVIIGAAAAWPIASSRLLLAMSNDKLFPPNFSKLHDKHKTPYKIVIFQTIMISLFTFIIFRGYTAGWVDSYRTAYLVYVLLTFMVISLVIFSVPILRKKAAKLPRVFKAPLPTVGPIIIVSIFLILIFNWIKIEGTIATSIIHMALSMLILGIPFFFLVEMHFNSKAIQKINSFLSPITFTLEEKLSQAKVKKLVLTNLPNLKNKKILELGCKTGKLTEHLAGLVGKNGKVFAIDFIKKSVKRTKKRTKHLRQVEAHHSHFIENFNLFLSQRANILISVGVLSYFQNPIVTLKNISKHLTKGAQIKIIEYDNLFYLISNVNWIKDKNKLKAIFKEAGFNIRVRKKKQLFWDMIIIDGFKTK